MSEDHGRIEELLAGYALLALDDADAAEAARLLAEHVPTCLECRRTIAGFHELTGDLALGTPSVPPPDLLLGRIHRAMDEAPVRARPRRGVTYLAAAASVVALLAMGGTSLTMAGRLDDAEEKAATALDAVISSADAVPLVSQGASTGTSSFVELADPEFRTLFLATRDCPDPRPGTVYQLWLGSDGDFDPYGQFLPDGHGHVMLRVEVDVTRYDEILITEELEGTRPSTPNLGAGRSWHATLT